MRNKRRVTSFNVLVYTFGAVLALAPCVTAQETPPEPNKQEWLKRYGTNPRLGQESTSGIKVKITAIEGDQPRTGDQREFRFDRAISYGCVVSTKGEVSSFSHSAFGSKGGGGGNPLDAARMKRIDEVLAKLPNDGKTLPPAGRRVVVQVPNGDHFLARVYDRADAPVQVNELLRLTNSGVRAWLPSFAPVKEWTAYEGHNSAVLGSAPVASTHIASAYYDSLKIWNAETYEKTREVLIPQGGGDEMIVSPDGSMAALVSWGDFVVLDTKSWRELHQFREPMVGNKVSLLSAAHFTPDGRFLLVQTGLNSVENGPLKMRIFDTKDWKQRDTLPDSPQDAASYFPAANGRAIYLTNTDALALWDTKRRRRVAQLDEKARISHVAFSPDGSLVAVATVHKNFDDQWYGSRIRIWKTASGKLLHELRPFEQNLREPVEGLLWSRDGRYVLAASNSHWGTSRGVSIWNANTGRHRGELVGCPTEVKGLVMQGDKIFAGCRDGIVRVWDTGKTFEQVKAFEQSLKTQPIR